MFYNRKALVAFVLTCALCSGALSFPRDVANAAAGQELPYEMYDAVAQPLASVPIQLRFGSAEKTTLVRSASLELLPVDLHDVQLKPPTDDENLDMDLAEINVFRPLFRYRAAYSKQVNTRRQQFG